MDNSVVALTFALEVIEAAVVSGFGMIQPDIFNLYNKLLVVSLFFTLGFWMIEGATDRTAGLIFKFITFIVLSWTIQNFQAVVDAVFTSVVGIGLDAGGSRMSAEQFRDPGSVAEMGLIAIVPLREQIKSIIGPVDIWWYIPELIIYLGTMLVVLIGFIILAWQVFFTLLGFLILGLAVFVCMPFAVLNKTAFIAERAMGYVVGVAVRLLVLALTVSVITATLLAFRWSPEPSIGEAVGVLTIAGAGFILAWWAPNEAAGLVNGGPVIDTRGAFVTLWTAAHVTSTLASAARGALSGFGGSSGGHRGADPGAYRGAPPSGTGGPAPGAPSPSPPSGVPAAMAPISAAQRYAAAVSAAHSNHPGALPRTGARP